MKIHNVQINLIDATLTVDYQVEKEKIISDDDKSIVISDRFTPELLYDLLDKYCKETNTKMKSLANGYNAITIATQNSNKDTKKIKVYDKTNGRTV